MLLRTKLVLLFIFGIISGAVSQGITWQDTLTKKLDSIWRQGYIAGFGVSIYSADSLYYMRGFGYADRESGRPYSPYTVQKIASLSKLVLGVAVMKSLQMGLFSLSDPADKYLPFKLVNPRAGNARIKIIHLVTHTSGIKQSPYDYRALYFPTKIRAPEGRRSLEWLAFDFLRKVLNANEYYTLEDYVVNVLSPNGKWYDPYLCFDDTPPGTKRIYSNIGASVAGLVIQRASGMDYTTFVHKYILDVLGLKQTMFDFEARSLPDSMKASLYHFGFKIPNDYVLLIPPAGGLESSVADFTRFMQKMIEGYEQGNEILPQKYYEMMLKQYFNNNFYQGIFWRVLWDGRAGHRGDIAGATTFAYFYKQYGTGYILFTNSAGSRCAEHEYHQILSVLERYTKRIGQARQAGESCGQKQERE